MDRHTGSPEFDFAHEKETEEDIELFGLDNPIRFGDGTLMAHLMFKVGIFSSVSQARKNGWDKPVPLGFNFFTVGKLKKKVYVLNSR
jgi:hypothetical protein|tara:strand:+ start:3127 stop:3387 length:261 start_codon:yes stop_codon:yes gene_type:complete